ncbi:GDSL esterase/lipase At3g43570-like [Triticum dicoccoides]|uniref:GDSL esterase/lipase At3g43570-like n=1 Tax=Triticum dicoccoides TaxID=85692 RepID=UPI0018919318|nr:GDSL esterase/lipase At3g43570-like [Triticum dicoccoides]
MAMGVRRGTTTVQGRSFIFVLVVLLAVATGVSGRTTYTGSSNTSSARGARVTTPPATGKKQGHGHGEKPTPPQTKPNTKQQVPALVVFGDSIVDPGNNNAIHTIVKANFPPYGHDFGADHRPTGRFCNGRIPTDFIASKLGLKQLLPAYLQQNLTKQDLLTGVSFASGGTGYDPLTAQLASVISMTDQLRMFHEYKAKVQAAAGDAALSEILSKGVFAVCAGSDDVANTYFTMRARSSYSHADYAHAEMINAGMGTAVESLKAKHPGARVVLMDIYGYLLDMMMRPEGYGFKESTLGCCGTGMMEVSVLCNGVTSAVCGDVTDYLFWDSYHPTEKAYRILVDFVYDNYLKELID